MPEQNPVFYPEETAVNINPLETTGQLRYFVEGIQEELGKEDVSIKYAFPAKAEVTAELSKEQLRGILIDIIDVEQFSVATEGDRVVVTVPVRLLSDPSLVPEDSTVRIPIIVKFTRVGKKGVTPLDLKCSQELVVTATKAQKEEEKEKVEEEEEEEEATPEQEEYESDEREGETEEEGEEKEAAKEGEEGEEGEQEPKEDRGLYSGLLAIDFGTTNSAVVVRDPRFAAEEVRGQLSSEQWRALNEWIDEWVIEHLSNHESSETDLFVENLIRVVPNTELPPCGASPDEIRRELAKLDEEQRRQVVIETLSRLSTIQDGEGGSSLLLQSIAPEVLEGFESVIDVKSLEAQRYFVLELDENAGPGPIPSAIQVISAPGTEDQPTLVQETKIDMGARVGLLMRSAASGGAHIRQFVLSVKRYFGRDDHIMEVIPGEGAAGDKPIQFTADTLCRLAYKELLNRAVDDIHRRAENGQFQDAEWPCSVVATFPVSYPASMRRTLRDIMDELQIKEMDTRFDEATAAAIYYVWREVGADPVCGMNGLMARCRHDREGRSYQNILLYDLGGGTTDIALIQLIYEELAIFEPNEDRGNGGRYFRITPRVLGTTGHRFIGGDLVTLWLFRLIKSKLADRLLTLLHERGIEPPVGTPINQIFYNLPEVLVENGGGSGRDRDMDMGNEGEPEEEQQPQSEEEEEDTYKDVAEGEDKLPPQKTPPQKAPQKPPQKEVAEEPVEEGVPGRYRPGALLEWTSHPMQQMMEYTKLNETVLDVIVPTRFAIDPASLPNFFILWEMAEELKKTLGTPVDADTGTSELAQEWPEEAEMDSGQLFTFFQSIHPWLTDSGNTTQDDLRLSITQEELSRCAKDPIKQSLSLAVSLSKSRLIMNGKFDRVDKLILSGLSCNLKVVQDTAREVFRESEGIFDFDPANVRFERESAKTAVAMGACIGRYLESVRVDPNNEKTRQMLRDGYDQVELVIENLFTYLACRLAYDSLVAMVTIFDQGTELNLRSYTDRRPVARTPMNELRPVQEKFWIYRIDFEGAEPLYLGLINAEGVAKENEFDDFRRFREEYLVGFEADAELFVRAFFVPKGPKNIIAQEYKEPDDGVGQIPDLIAKADVKDFPDAKYMENPDDLLKVNYTISSQELFERRPAIKAGTPLDYTIEFPDKSKLRCALSAPMPIREVYDFYLDEDAPISIPGLDKGKGKAEETGEEEEEELETKASAPEEEEEEDITKPTPAEEPSEESEEEEEDLTSSTPAEDESEQDQEEEEEEENSEEEDIRSSEEEKPEENQEEAEEEEEEKEEETSESESEPKQDRREGEVEEGEDKAKYKDKLFPTKKSPVDANDSTARLIAHFFLKEEDADEATLVVDETGRLLMLTKSQFDIKIWAEIEHVPQKVDIHYDPFCGLH